MTHKINLVVDIKEFAIKPIRPNGRQSLIFVNLSQCNMTLVSKVGKRSISLANGLNRGMSTLCCFISPSKFVRRVMSRLDDN